MKQIAVTKEKEVSQIKPRLGQGRAGLRPKKKMPVTQLISRPVAQETEKPTEQPKVILKVPVPESSRICDKIVPVSAIPHISSGNDLSSKMVKRKTIWDANREIPIYPDPVYIPLLNQ